MKFRKEGKTKGITEDWGRGEEKKKFDRNNIKKQLEGKLRRKWEGHRLKKVENRCAWGAYDNTVVVFCIFLCDCYWNIHSNPLSITLNFKKSL
jgi:hypothetical protein